jgi:hypothetical protein
MRRFLRPALALALTVGGYIGMGITGDAGRNSTVYRTTHHTPMGLATAYLVAFAAFLTGLFLLIRAAWRAFRAKRGWQTKHERAMAANADARKQAEAAWHEARVLATRLREGAELPTLSFWGVILEPGETAHLDLTGHYARYYSTTGTYTHVSGYYRGSAGFVAGNLLADSLGNAMRRKEAARLAQAQWREWQQVRVIVTDRRLHCSVNGTWLRFDFSAVKAFYPEPAKGNVVFDYNGTSPLMLTGPAAPLVAVYATWRLHGTAAIDQHPGLAALRV